MEWTLFINRREFCQGAATVALAAAALGTTALSPLGATASAQTVTAAELMKPGTIPDMAIGNEKAPVTIVEYASMTCPHCAHFQETTFPELKKRYIDTGKVRYIFREFPLDALALDGAMLARCIANGDANKYIAMVDVLFAQQENWAREYKRGTEHPALENKQMLALAKQAGMTDKAYKECFANQDIQRGILLGLQRAGNDFKIRSTPSFFINGNLKAGALSIDEMAKEIDAQLKDK